MILPDFDRNNCSWDAFKRPHNLHGTSYYTTFVQFDTGELICTKNAFNPDQRRFFKQLNVSIVGTGDPHCPKFVTPDGRAISKTVLARFKMQTLLVDHDTRRVVALNSHARNVRTGAYNTGDMVIKPADWQAHVPVSLRLEAYAYFPGPGEPPQGDRVKLTWPNALTDDEKAHKDAMIRASKAWVAMTATKRKHHAKGLLWSTHGALPFDQLGDEQRMQLAFSGWEMGVDVERCDYLLVADERRFETASQTNDVEEDEAEIVTD